MTEPLEIERKFLIEMPDRTLLDRCPVRWECRVSSDPHERRNDLGTVSTTHPVKLKYQ